MKNVGESLKRRRHNGSRRGVDCHRNPATSSIRNDLRDVENPFSQSISCWLESNCSHFIHSACSFLWNINRNLNSTVERFSLGAEQFSDCAYSFLVCAFSLARRISRPGNKCGHDRVLKNGEAPISSHLLLRRRRVRKVYKTSYIKWTWNPLPAVAPFLQSTQLITLLIGLYWARGPVTRWSIVGTRGSVELY